MTVTPLRVRVSALLCVGLLCAPALAREAVNPFGRSLQVESSAAGGVHRGEIRAVLEQPYAVAAPALAQAAHWCEILTLQVNIKRCEASPRSLTAFITRKPRDAVDNAYRVDFQYSATASADRLHVTLRAATGPMGTRDYEIQLEAAAAGPGRTLLHLSYAYTLGPMARLAMDAYLVGPGRDKYGFTVVERLPDGRPVYVDGVRGVVERSAMRYYLAVEAQLESLGVPAAERLDARLRRWYTSVTSFPQLREPVGFDEYVEMKRREAGPARAAG